MTMTTQTEPDRSPERGGGAEADVRLAPTKHKLAERLRFLASYMEDVAVSMNYYGDCAQWAQHAREMMGAADLCREWSDDILAS
jgi:hypothetical protein